MGITRGWQRDVPIGEKCRHSGYVVRTASGTAHCNMCGVTWPSVGCYEATRIDTRPAMAADSQDFEARLEDAGRLHEVIKERIAAAVAEGRDKGSVSCPCGSAVMYAAENSFGYRPARCMREGCMRGAVRLPEMVQ